MIFNVHIGEKVDLSRFRKQATHYIGQLPWLQYHIYLPDFRIILDLITAEKSNAHTGTLTIDDITRDQEGEMIDSVRIIPSFDARLKNIKSVQELFEVESAYAIINSNSVAETVDKTCGLIKLVAKINKLSAFA